MRTFQESERKHALFVRDQLFQALAVIATGYEKIRQQREELEAVRNRELLKDAAFQAAREQNKK